MPPTGVCLNSHTHGRLKFSPYMLCAYQFQPTPPHRGRHCQDFLARSASGFNPRPHTGGDFRRRSRLYPFHVSIHAPTQGATQSIVYAPVATVFQSTPPHRGRPRLEKGAELVFWFQSTPPHRGRPRHHGADRALPVSIHAPTQGATVSYICS